MRKLKSGERESTKQQATATSRRPASSVKTASSERAGAGRAHGCGLHAADGSQQCWSSVFTPRVRVRVRARSWPEFSFVLCCSFALSTTSAANNMAGKLFVTGSSREPYAGPHLQVPHFVPRAPAASPHPQMMMPQHGGGGPAAIYPPHHFGSVLPPYPVLCCAVPLSVSGCPLLPRFANKSHTSQRLKLTKTQVVEQAVTLIFYY